MVTIRISLLNLAKLGHPLTPATHEGRPSVLTDLPLSAAYLWTSPPGPQNARGKTDSDAPPRSFIILLTLSKHVKPM